MQNQFLDKNIFINNYNYQLNPSRRPKASFTQLLSKNINQNAIQSNSQIRPKAESALFLLQQQQHNRQQILLNYPSKFKTPSQSNSGSYRQEDLLSQYRVSSKEGQKREYHLVKIDNQSKLQEQQSKVEKNEESGIFEGQIFLNNIFKGIQTIEEQNRAQQQQNNESALKKNNSSLNNNSNLSSINSQKNLKLDKIQEQNQKEISQNSKILNTSKSHFSSQKQLFNMHYVVGKGGFGKVWKVELKKSRKIYAMKEMSKSLVISKKSVASVLNEKNILSQLKHPFLVNMVSSFQDRDNLYLVMDFMSGGDLRYHISRKRKFSEEQAKFFVINILLGLEYLHKNNIIHRDIKPENLVLNSEGYVKITDFGVARVWHSDNQSDTSGTPGYMAPEVMCRQPHTFAVDYFALGVIAFEFMFGRRPYNGKTRQEIREQILSKKVQIKKCEIPEGWSIESADFINRMIERKPAQRLGINGPDEVKNHPWIKYFQWKQVYKKQLEAPFKPSMADNFDFNQLITSEGEQDLLLVQQNAILLRKPQVQSLFEEYNSDYQIQNFQE